MSWNINSLCNAYVMVIVIIIAPVLIMLLLLLMEMVVIISQLNSIRCILLMVTILILMQSRLDRNQGRFQGDEVLLWTGSGQAEGDLCDYLPAAEPPHDRTVPLLVVWVFSSVSCFVLVSVMITEARFSQLLESAFTPEPKLRFSGSLRETGGDVGWSDPLTFVVKSMVFQQLSRHPLWDCSAKLV